jgi:hypothetical protein
MVENGVTHNFIREDVAQDIGLQLKLAHTTFKSINLGMEKVIGTTKDILLKLGDWNESVSFTIVPMDDFEVVFGQDFTRRVKVSPIPHLDSLSIFFSERPCMVPAMRRNKEAVNRMTSLSLIVADNQGAK